MFFNKMTELIHCPAYFFTFFSSKPELFLRAFRGTEFFKTVSAH